MNNSLFHCLCSVFVLVVALLCSVCECVWVCVCVCVLCVDVCLWSCTNVEVESGTSTAPEWPEEKLTNRTTRI